MSVATANALKVKWPAVCLRKGILLAIPVSVHFFFSKELEETERSK